MTKVLSAEKMRKTLSFSLAIFILTLSLMCSFVSVSAEEKAFGDFMYTEGTEGVYITEYKGDGVNVKVPEEIDGKKVVGIDTQAFWYNRRVESVELPDSIVALGSRVFQGCESLVSVNLPEGLMNIEDACFAQCVSLKNIELPQSLHYVGGGVFDDTPYIEKYEGDSIILDDRIFYFYRGSSDYVEIPEGITCISASAFLECESLCRVDIHDSVEIIGGYAFYGCDNLKSIKIPRDLAEVGPYAFGCYTESGNPEPQVMKDFVIYSYSTDSEGNESLGSAYAKEYGLTLKGEGEEPYYIPESERGNSKISLKTILLIVFVSALVIVVGGGMFWGFMSDKKAKEQAKDKRLNARKNKKNKR